MLSLLNVAAKIITEGSAKDIAPKDTNTAEVTTTEAIEDTATIVGGIVYIVKGTAAEAMKDSSAKDTAAEDTIRDSAAKVSIATTEVTVGTQLVPLL
jgi:hypothetical protein